jgi:WD repeat-containing protein 35
MESFKSRLIDAQITNITQNTVNKPTTTLDTLITSDLSNVSDKTLNNPWKGAEAYHFYMLCQAQLYQNQNKAALKTALRLVLYEKELGAKEVYRLIALSAYLNGSFKECSKALSKLEHLNTLNKMQREAYRKLSIAIFTKERPVNRNSKTFDCPNKKCDAKISEFDIDCKTCGSNFSPCVVSGQSVLQREYFKCKRCKHKCLKNEVYNKSVKYCPLCHVVLDISKAESNKDD